MLALPDATSLTAFLLLGAGAAGGLLCVRLVGWRVRALLPDPAARGPLGLILALSLALGVAVAPLGAWRLIEDARYTSAIEPYIAERIGAYENYLDGRTFDALARQIPPGDSYFIQVSPKISSERARTAFSTWAVTWLLPRKPAASPEAADWIITWGVEPQALGVALEPLRVVGKPYYDFPATYLARVAP